MASQYRLVLCTCPDQQTGERLAGELVRRRLAACVNVVPGLTSVYEWEGRIESDPEVLLYIKTNAATYERMETTLRELHPYELPEIIAVPIETGLAGYLAWIDETVENR
jgi:periplasmic divalent cation tolerance protein